MPLAMPAEPVAPSFFLSPVPPRRFFIGSRAAGERSRLLPVSRRDTRQPFDGAAIAAGTGACGKQVTQSSNLLTQRWSGRLK